MRGQLFHKLQERFGVDENVYRSCRESRDDPTRSTAWGLVDRRLITEAQFLEAAGEVFDLPFWSELPLDGTDTRFSRQVPIQFLKRYTMVPLISVQPSGNPLSGPTPGAPVCTIAVNDPAAFPAVDDLARILELPDFSIVLAPRNAIQAAINRAYDMNRDSAERLVQDMEQTEGEIITEIEKTADLLDDLSDAPIIKLVNHIISQAVKARASDIHIEPYQESFKVRYRVDGILYDLLSPPKWIEPVLTSRIKVMAKMDIAEKRLPQDGRIQVGIGGQDIDIRVSTIPTAFGERVVLRLLSKSSSLLQLSELGMAGGAFKRVSELIRSPNGIILVTGPTGSGKTTTLYAILSSINTPDINIITIEDPVEYQIRGISQIQANPKIGLTFARGLRSIVRQDPDVILIGEIRDRETSEIAVQSALTGHLVFSTLHTNDSASAITRMVDIGVEPFLISSAVLAVMAQRLIRVLCDRCKQPQPADPLALDRIGLAADDVAGRTLYRACGCPYCLNTGYRGRMGIFEIMELREPIKHMILKTYDANQIRATALEQGMTTLRQDGVRKVLEGTTTIEEVLRVTQG